MCHSSSTQTLTYLSLSHLVPWFLAQSSDKSQRIMYNAQGETEEHDITVLADRERAYRQVSPLRYSQYSTAVRHGVARGSAPRTGRPQFVIGPYESAVISRPAQFSQTRAFSARVLEPPCYGRKARHSQAVQTPCL